VSDIKKITTEKMQVLSLFSPKLTVTVGYIVMLVLLLDYAYDFSSVMRNGMRPWSTGNNVFAWILFIVYVILFLSMGVAIFKMHT
jgi:hypothetical protein